MLTSGAGVDHAVHLIILQPGGPVLARNFQLVFLGIVSSGSLRLEPSSVVVPLFMHHQQRILPCQNAGLTFLCAMEDTGRFTEHGRNSTHPVVDPKCQLMPASIHPAGKSMTPRVRAVMCLGH